MVQDLGLRSVRQTEKKKITAFDKETINAVRRICEKKTTVG